MNLIDVKNLLFKYKMYSGEKEEVIERTAVDDVSLSIKKGDFIGILGHNGSGKSTLAKQLAALLKPSDGVVYVNGMDTTKEEDLLSIRKTAGMVFQNPDNQLIGNIVEEDVAFGPENMGIPAEEIEQRIAKALESTGMTAYREISPGTLSGGQKQKVAISGVLAMEPECIIFDEPTAMIDPESRKEVLEAIYELNRLKGITIIYITHFLQEVSQADYLYVMNHGKVTMEGTPESLFKTPEKLTENNLELPFEIALIAELRKKGMLIPDEIYSKGQLLAHLEKEIQKNEKNSKEKGTKDEGKKQVDKLEDILESKSIVQAESGRVSSPPKSISEDTFFAVINESNNQERKISKGIVLENISYQYRKRSSDEGRYALKEVSLSIEPGEFVAIVGRTGSGKSTLIQHFNGLLQPAKGKYFFDGKDIWEKKYDLKKLRQKVALCFQYPEYQLFEETVLKDISFGPKNLGFDKKTCKEKAQEAMRLVGLSKEFENVSPFSLSGGQKRRVALAGILAMEPEYLILDEPVAGLDAPGKRMLFELLHHLNEEKGITIVLVSHNMDDVASHAKRVIVMQDGTIQMDGETEEVFVRKDELIQMGLGIPQAAEFYLELEKLRKKDSKEQDLLLKKTLPDRENKRSLGTSREISAAENIPLNIEKLAEYIAGGSL